MHSQVKSVASLSLLYAFRMLGLFMVLPVMMLYGDGYAGATPFLLGVALGAYGLTQAVFQIPLGLLSDLFGRKPVILIGLLIFAIGSLVAGSATSIEGLIIGRALQGAGAIASAIMAMVADLTTEDNRTKAMAAIGASIGLSFSIAMVLGPVLASVAGLSGVFFVTCGLALLGVLVLLFVVPKPAQPAGKSHRDSGAIPALMGKTAQNPQLLRLNLGIFSLHFVLMSAFVVVPRILESGLGIARESHWHIYLGLLLGALIIMMPFMMLAERKRMVKQVFLLAIFLLGVALVALALWHATAMVVITLLLLFFVAFNLLEATLPSLVSKVAPAGAKGTAMGLYSTSQFLGAFAGGTLGGWLLEQHSATAVLFVAATVTAVWLLVAIFMQAPRYLTSICINVGGDFARTPAVLSVTGVAEALMVPEEGLLYLKVDRQALDQQQLAHVVGTEV
ncbi:MFS transporter [Teredinibacter turnerae]|uniref:MFS transporter n=1 Tax=Teredinibacter turnerae TaxID=2426 RepID=UPI00036ACA0A|nr:MFS transporter [Teredinibacter turnerae]